MRTPSVIITIIVTATVVSFGVYIFNTGLSNANHSDSKAVRTSIFVNNNDLDKYDNKIVSGEDIISALRIYKNDNLSININNKCYINNLDIQENGLIVLTPCDTNVEEEIRNLRQDRYMAEKEYQTSLIYQQNSNDIIQLKFTPITTQAVAFGDNDTKGSDYKKCIEYTIKVGDFPDNIKVQAYPGTTRLGDKISIGDLQRITKKTEGQSVVSWIFGEQKITSQADLNKISLNNKKDITLTPQYSKKLYCIKYYDSNNNEIKSDTYSGNTNIIKWPQKDKDKDYLVFTNWKGKGENKNKYTVGQLITEKNLELYPEYNNKLHAKISVKFEGSKTTNEIFNNQIEIPPLTGGKMWCIWYQDNMVGIIDSSTTNFMLTYEDYKDVMDYNINDNTFTLTLKQAGRLNTYQITYELNDLSETEIDGWKAQNNISSNIVKSTDSILKVPELPYTEDNLAWNVTLNTVKLTNSNTQDYNFTGGEIIHLGSDNTKNIIISLVKLDKNNKGGHHE